ncbi:MAG: type II toxin-antitoxin system VapC family toxin [Rhodocyclaceae bacterium]|nr:type II toxin-antitoxin system VapC family toxin [Rhodocyclaceae bacterium]
MIGLDTNILLRILVDDESRDVAKARNFVATYAAQGHDFYVDTVVLIELVWVLESVFNYGRDHIATAIDALLANVAYILDGREAVAIALTAFRSSRADFSDCLIAARCQQMNCNMTVTLDRAMHDLVGVTLITK